MILLEKAKDIFIDREKMIQTYIEGESIALFEKADLLEDKFCRLFAIQIVSNGIGDAYDFFCYIHGTNNLFYKNIKQLDEKMANNIFKWLSLYHTLSYKEKNRVKFNEIKEAMVFIFNWNENDKKLYKYFKKMKRRSNSHFQWQFAKFMLHDIFKQQALNPVMLAHVGNLIYNSHKTFCSEISNIRIINETPKPQEEVYMVM